MKVSIHPEALTEFEEAAAYYEDHQSGLGEKLVAAVESAIFIQANPTAPWAPSKSRVALPNRSVRPRTQPLRGSVLPMP
jgi:hypothetical protein